MIPGEVAAVFQPQGGEAHVRDSRAGKGVEPDSLPTFFLYLDLLWC